MLSEGSGEVPIEDDEELAFEVEHPALVPAALWGLNIWLDRRNMPESWWSA